MFYTLETLVPCLASHSTKIVLQILSLASACDRKLLESLMPTSWNDPEIMVFISVRKPYRC